MLKEVNIQYPSVTKLAYAKTVEANGKLMDTIPTFMVRWEKITATEKQLEKEKMERWLQQRLVLDTLRIIEF